MSMSVGAGRLLMNCSLRSLKSVTLRFARSAAWDNAAPTFFQIYAIRAAPEHIESHSASLFNAWENYIFTFNLTC
jgi:hypothetical protein